MADDDKVEQWWQGRSQQEKNEVRGLYRPRRLTPGLVRSLKEAKVLDDNYQVGDKVPDDTDLSIFLKARH